MNASLNQTIKIAGRMAALVLLVFASASQALPISGISISGGEAFADWDTNGWRFEALSNINVLSLGTWDEGGNGLPSSVDVGLWTDAGALLASLTLGAGTSATLDAGFRYQSLLSSIALTAGQFYRVGSSANSGSLEYRQGGIVVSAAGIAYDDGFYAGSRYSLTFPSIAGATPNTPDFFGANFQYEAVPVPATLTLFGLGLAGLGWSRRKQPL